MSSSCTSSEPASASRTIAAMTGNCAVVFGSAAILALAGCSSGSDPADADPKANGSRERAAIQPGRSRDDTPSNRVISDENPPGPQPPNRPIEVAMDGYVSSDACRECHPHNHATWHASYHRAMTQVATKETVIGDFENVSLEFDGQTYELARRDDQFVFAWHEASQMRRERPIVMTTGSHHMQGYWYATGVGRKLGQLPFMYLKDEQRWVPRHTVFLVPPDKPKSRPEGLWNMVCAKCHATHPKPRSGSLGTMDTFVGEFGISCEACHGPGEPHVRLHKETNSVGGKNEVGHDDPIVNPARLDHKRSSQVCGQCHSINLFRTREDFARWISDGPQFRPGGRLEEFRHLLNLRGPQSEVVRERLEVDADLFAHSFWNDGMVRVSGREYHGLVESACFEGGEMSCLSCHTMHQSKNDDRPIEQWTNDQLKPSMDGNAACIQCHEAYNDAERLTAHTHHAAESTGSVCYNCHMPHTTYGLLKAIRSHQIEKPDVASTLKTGRPNGCNQCHLDKSLGWTADRLSDWYGAARPKLSDEQETIAASLHWLLSGDAGQRALAASSMGWRPAQQESGTYWMAPYLGILLEDPYDAVRFISHRSLRTLPHFHELDYDFLGPSNKLTDARRRVREMWVESVSNDAIPGEAILIDPERRLRNDTIKRMLERRDDRPIDLHK